MLSRPMFLYRPLLPGLEAHGLWLKSFLLDVSPVSMCDIFRSGQQTNSHSRQDSWSGSQRSLLKMPHTDGGETSSRNDFNHRPRTSGADITVLYNINLFQIANFGEIFRSLRQAKLLIKYINKYTASFMASQFSRPRGFGFLSVGTPKTNYVLRVCCRHSLMSVSEDNGSFRKTAEREYMLRYDKVGECIGSLYTVIHTVMQKQIWKDSSPAVQRRESSS